MSKALSGHISIALSYRISIALSYHITKALSDDISSVFILLYICHPYISMSDD